MARPGELISHDFLSTVMLGSELPEGSAPLSVEEYMSPPALIADVMEGSRLPDEFNLSIAFKTPWTHCESP